MKMPSKDVISGLMPVLNLIPWGAWERDFIPLSLSKLEARELD